MEQNEEERIWSSQELVERRNRGRKEDEKGGSGILTWESGIKMGPHIHMYTKENPSPHL